MRQLPEALEARLCWPSLTQIDQYLRLPVAGGRGGLLLLGLPYAGPHTLCVPIYTIRSRRSIPIPSLHASMSIRRGSAGTKSSSWCAAAAASRFRSLRQTSRWSAAISHPRCCSAPGSPPRLVASRSNSSSWKCVTLISADAVLIRSWAPPQLHSLDDFMDFFRSVVGHLSVNGRAP